MYLIGSSTEYPVVAPITLTIESIVRQGFEFTDGWDAKPIRSNRKILFSRLSDDLIANINLVPLLPRIEDWTPSPVEISVMKPELFPPDPIVK